MSKIDSSITRKYGGVGLGLSITKALTTLMNGTLSVVSEVGNGSTFSIKMTMMLADASRAVSPSLEHDLGNVSVENAHNFLNAEVNILIVEDNPVNQKVIKSYLNRLGFKQITIANNGKEGLEALGVSQFDLVLSDIQMPIMDGLTFAKTVRQQLKIGHIELPIVALSAHSFVGEKEYCFEVGMDDYLAKPLEMSRLIQCLMRWVPKKGQTQKRVPSNNLASEPQNMQTEEFSMDIKISDQMKILLGEAYQDILKTFLSDTKEKVNQLVKAVSDNDIVKTNSLAHQLKSSTASFGAMSLSQYCRLLESMSKKGTLTAEATMLCKHIQDHYSQMESFFSKSQGR
jgi:CheY-like chemotaxis protein/HPt (histidine-containing phosphotransfer) domain-containing protein